MKKVFTYANNKVHLIEESWGENSYAYGEYIDSKVVKRYQYEDGFMYHKEELIDGKIRMTQYHNTHKYLRKEIYDNVTTTYFADGEVRKVSDAVAKTSTTWEKSGVYMKTCE